MSPRTGRPKSDNSKGTMLRVRIDKETERKLEVVSNELQITKSDVVRNGIEAEYKNITQKK